MNSKWVFNFKHNLGYILFEMWLTTPKPLAKFTVTPCYRLPEKIQIKGNIRILNKYTKIVNKTIFQPVLLLITKYLHTNSGPNNLSFLWNPPKTCSYPRSFTRVANCNHSTCEAGKKMEWDSYYGNPQNSPQILTARKRLKDVFEVPTFADSRARNNANDRLHSTVGWFVDGAGVVWYRFAIPADNRWVAHVAGFMSVSREGAASYTK